MGADTDVVLPLIGDAFAHDVRQPDNKPSKLRILPKQRRNVVRIYDIRLIRSRPLILFKQRQNGVHIVVTPMWRFIEDDSLVARRICDLHG
jgi:hypothetical protein